MGVVFAASQEIGQVDDALRLRLYDGPHHILKLGHVTPHYPYLVSHSCKRGGSGVNVKAYYLFAPLHQFAYDPRTDKACTTQYEHGHLALLLSTCRLFGCETARFRCLVCVRTIASISKPLLAVNLSFQVQLFRLAGSLRPQPVITMKIDAHCHSGIGRNPEVSDKEHCRLRRPVDSGSEPATYWIRGRNDDEVGSQPILSGG